LVLSGPSGENPLTFGGVKSGIRLKVSDVGEAIALPAGSSTAAPTFTV
jgi:hypothetical protein